MESENGVAVKSAKEKESLNAILQKIGTTQSEDVTPLVTCVSPRKGIDPDTIPTQHSTVERMSKIYKNRRSPSAMSPASTERNHLFSTINGR